ncbi:putative endochitinase CHI2 [Ustulina deusta]|nr:putative endochitinase CHI2 [Ustulina deusta]KAI3342883.1 putative endochitinase CHI2 [Ustulina deusta]
MHFTKVSAGLGLLAGAATAMPTSFKKTRASSSALNVVYWGQNGGGTIENNDLSAYCTADAGIDILVLSFLYQFGSGNTIPSGTVGQSCFISTSGQGQNCDALSSAIKTCQSNGVTIILSLGGASGAYSLASSDEATTIGNYLWEAYGNSGSTSVQRPFGDAFVNGFDFDLELNRGNQYYADMISTLRKNFASDSSNKYYITGAPQCPIPEPNMGVVIDNSQFDYLWPQFYNNNNYTYPCALPINGNAPFNYDEWLTYTAGTPSANAKIFVGVPAAPLGANGSPSGETYYATPDQLASIIGDIKGDSRFGGIMMWSAGFSDSNVVGGCNYAQQARSILDSGSPCGGGSGGGSPPSSSTTTTTSKPTSTTKPTGTSTTSSPTSTATGTVPQWGQCGGMGYTGPTKCQSPYTCVATGDWWSQCQ